MAERTIVGVDFSGEGEDSAVGKTWVTEGQFEERTLVINEPRPISRAELIKLLSSLGDNAVAALDFPFGVPREFALFWLKKKGKPPANPTALTMKDVWQLTECTKPEEFRELVDQFAPGTVNTPKEYLRVGDLSEASSCLHRINPDMVPMTFQGMRMLHRLCSAERTILFEVPPLKKLTPASPVLLEVMPGAALRTFGLPFKGYKSKRPENARKKARKKREQIFDQLEKKSEVSIGNLGKYREQCLDNDDCLDSVVAAIVAGLWSMESEFCLPSKEQTNEERWRSYQRKPSPSVIGMTELDAAKLEGWIYIPHYPNEPPHRHPPYLRPNC